jgi:DNA-binding LacI/PurR family transcriptional regulator
VAVPTDEAARMSIELLLALIERRSASPVMRVTATPQLVERASTAAPRR